MNSVELNNIDLTKVPKHIAIIMDGNGRNVDEMEGKFCLAQA